MEPFPQLASPSSPSTGGGRSEEGFLLLFSVAIGGGGGCRNGSHLDTAPPLPPSPSPFYIVRRRLVKRTVGEEVRRVERGSFLYGTTGTVIRVGGLCRCLRWLRGEEAIAGTLPPS